MKHNSLKTYMRKGGFRTSTRPSIKRTGHSGLAVVQRRSATLHYNCLPREVNIIAHSCGVEDPRQLDRSHCRVMGQDGISVPLEKLFPYPKQRVVG